MRKQGTRERFKLHLLAFVLACALLWYSINPVPYTAARHRKPIEDDNPDGERREAEPEFTRRPAPLSLHTFDRFYEPSDARPLADEEPDDFDWPEFIDG